MDNTFIAEVKFKILKLCQNTIHQNKFKPILHIRQHYYRCYENDDNQIF